MVSWCRRRPSSTALQQRKHASGVLADVPALSRLKHGFESRRERQSHQWLRLTTGWNRKSGDTPGTHSRGGTRHQARAYERFVPLTLFLHLLVTTVLDYPASLRAPYLRRGF